MPTDFIIFKVLICDRGIVAFIIFEVHIFGWGINALSSRCWYMK